ncbi:hypothetical protein CY34DRAFT_16491 [Suillus luteus UH-Slu-Lm8-n1]|uniref:Uncharacterized protein n=1 Tax=Suillus luteus UH-Slu-Lm8-n1 TaxID=930992 RepID=A0A0C9ZFQ2_9AGAM|nr:hypothetical protein CY34DRAFT_16491 [Suillus luteus UH-Slu-Lm8-n1]
MRSTTVFSFLSLLILPSSIIFAFLTICSLASSSSSFSSQKQEEVLKRIEDESRVKPGDPGMFKHYQAAVKRVMAELDDNELEKVKETTEEWLNNCLPPEIQAQVARKKGLALWSTF